MAKLSVFEFSELVEKFNKNHDTKTGKFTSAGQTPQSVVQALDDVVRLGGEKLSTSFDDVKVYTASAKGDSFLSGDVVAAFTRAAEPGDGLRFGDTRYEISTVNRDGTMVVLKSGSIKEIKLDLRKKPVVQLQLYKRSFLGTTYADKKYDGATIEERARNAVLDTKIGEDHWSPKFQPEAMKIPSARRSFLVGEVGAVATEKLIAAEEDFTRSVNFGRALALRRAAIEVEGRDLGAEFTKYSKLPERADPDLVAAYRANKAFTTEYVRQNYGENVRLFRGLGPHTYERIAASPEVMRGQKTLPVTTNSLSSWTSSSVIAGNFANNSWHTRPARDRRGAVVSATFRADEIAFVSDVHPEFDSRYSRRRGFEFVVATKRTVVEVEPEELYSTKSLVEQFNKYHDAKTGKFTSRDGVARVVDEAELERMIVEMETRLRGGSAGSPAQTSDPPSSPESSASGQTWDKPPRDRYELHDRLSEVMRSEFGAWTGRVPPMVTYSKSSREDAQLGLHGAHGIANFGTSTIAIHSLISPMLESTLQSTSIFMNEHLNSLHTLVHEFVHLSGARILNDGEFSGGSRFFEEGITEALTRAKLTGIVRRVGYHVAPYVRDTTKYYNHEAEMVTRLARAVSRSDDATPQLTKWKRRGSSYEKLGDDIISSLNQPARMRFDLEFSRIGRGNPDADRKFVEWVEANVEVQKSLVEQYNPFHDGKTGKFTSGAQGPGSVYVPRKGSRGYRLDEYEGEVGPRARDTHPSGEFAVGDEVRFYKGLDRYGEADVPGGKVIGWSADGSKVQIDQYYGRGVIEVDAARIRKQYDASGKYQVEKISELLAIGNAEKKAKAERKAERERKRKEKFAKEESERVEELEKALASIVEGRYRGNHQDPPATTEELERRLDEMFGGAKIWRRGKDWVAFDRDTTNQSVWEQAHGKHTAGYADWNGRIHLSPNYRTVLRRFQDGAPIISDHEQRVATSLFHEALHVTAKKRSASEYQTPRGRSYEEGLTEAVAQIDAQSFARAVGFRHQFTDIRSLAYPTEVASMIVLADFASGKRRPSYAVANSITVSKVDVDTARYLRKWKFASEDDRYTIIRDDVRAGLAKHGYQFPDAKIDDAFSSSRTAIDTWNALHALSGWTLA
jgi:hypothetical protein